ncbi:MAG: ribonuclease PH [Chthoniobacterales bacterium]
MTRADNRAQNELRPIRIETNFAPHATGSVLFCAGNTRVICSATIDEDVPRWMKDQKVVGGWVTSEYSMLPYSTLTRKPRDIAKGKLDGRSSEIQRLIGRSMRAAIDLKKLGSRTLWIDCDVLQADGGTRTASITGACIATELAFQKLIAQGLLKESPLKQLVAAISVGVVDGTPCLDLNYVEDKDASVDFNLVMTEKLEFVEVQGTGEENVFTTEELNQMLELGKGGITQLLEIQRKILKETPKL